MKTSVLFCAGILALTCGTVALHAEDIETLMQKYFELATSDKPEAEAAAKKVGADFLVAAKDDSNNLNEFAWKIMADDDIKKRDLELAMKVAKAAFDACEGKSAAIVDTYARAFFDTGKIEDGIAWQKKAVALCEDDGSKSELEETLKRYETKAAEMKKAAEPKK